MLKCLDGWGAIEILTVSFPVNIIEEILPSQTINSIKCSYG